MFNSKNISGSIFFIAFTLSPGFANGAIVSSIHYDGACIALPSPEQDLREIVTGSTGSIVGLVASSLVKGGLTFASAWLSSFKDSFQGADSATSADAFYCEAGEMVGHREFLTFRRTQLSMDKRKNSVVVQDSILIRSRVSVFVEPGKVLSGMFMLTPTSIDYRDPISARGSIKDLTITYSFEIAGEGQSPVNLTVDPFVIKALRKGDKFDNLDEHIGSMMVGPIPAKTSLKKAGSEQDVSAPFKFSITLAETAEGNGVELAGKIAKELSASIDQHKDELVAKIVDAIIKNRDMGDQAIHGNP